MYESPTEDRRKKGRPYRLAIVFAIIAFLIFAPEIQESNSMDPTIQDGDAFIIYKFVQYSAKRKAPERDTLVVLDKTVSLDAGAEDNITGRVIAVPGDTVQISEDTVFVNNKPYISRHGIEGAKGTYAKTKLKGNQVFVLSDNRLSKEAASLDSRNPKLGLVDMRKIRGNIVLKVWPLNHFRLMNKQ